MERLMKVIFFLATCLVSRVLFSDFSDLSDWKGLSSETDATAVELSLPVEASYT
jgi:hypothetical protein